MQIRRWHQHIPHWAREDAHCCCVLLYLAPSLLSTHTLPSLPHISSLQSVTFSFYSGHIRDEITHLAPGPVFIMYEWFYPGHAWCPFFAREAARCPAFISGWPKCVRGAGQAGPGAPLRSVGLVHAHCGLLGCCAGSQSGSASDKLPIEVSCAESEAEQRGEERAEQHTCPHHWEGSGPSKPHLWIVRSLGFDDYLPPSLFVRPFWRVLLS